MIETEVRDKSFCVDEIYVLEFQASGKVCEHIGLKGRLKILCGWAIGHN